MLQCNSKIQDTLNILINFGLFWAHLLILDEEVLKKTHFLQKLRFSKHSRFFLLTLRFQLSSGIHFTYIKVHKSQIISKGQGSSEPKTDWSFGKTAKSKHLSFSSWYLQSLFEGLCHLKRKLQLWSSNSQIVWFCSFLQSSNFLSPLNSW